MEAELGTVVVEEGVGAMVEETLLNGDFGAFRAASDKGLESTCTLRTLRTTGSSSSVLSKRIRLLSFLDIMLR